MANAKISELTEINLGEISENDFLVVVDTSDTSQSSDGSTKKITMINTTGSVAS